MKIGMIVHSETGHTMGVAQAISEQLRAEGHAVEILSVVAKSKRPWKEQVPSLQETPDPHGYDVLVMGAPVWGFCLSQVMKEYLYAIRPLKVERLVLFSTGALPRFFGGKRAMKQMASILKAPDDRVVFAGAARFPRRKRPRYIEEVVDNAVKAVMDMGDPETKENAL